jgi:hypothetical protein
MPQSFTDELTPTQRRQEIAAILGRGLLRLGSCPAQKVQNEPELLT